MEKQQHFVLVSEQNNKNLECISEEIYKHKDGLCHGRCLVYASISFVSTFC